MKSQKILLWGWFGFENLGDDLLLNTMLENLSPYSGTITVPMRSQYDIKYQNVKQIERNYAALFREIPHNDMLIIGPGGLFPFDNPIYCVVVESLWTKSSIFWSGHFRTHGFIQ